MHINRKNYNRNSISVPYGDRLVYQNLRRRLSDASDAKTEIRAKQINRIMNKSRDRKTNTSFSRNHNTHIAQEKTIQAQS